MSTRAARRAAARRKAAAKKGVSKGGRKRKPTPKTKTSLKAPGLTAAKLQFSILLAGATGLSAKVIAAWAIYENGPDDNPLNIGPGNHYGSLLGGVKATSDLLHTSLYKGIMDTAGKSDQEQIAAIAASSWCPGCAGYEQDLTNVYNGISGSAAGSTSVGKGGASGEVQADTNSTGIDAVGEGIANIVKFIARIFEPEFWLRVGKVVLGALALLLGAVLLGNALLGNTAVGKVTNPGKAAARKGYERVRGYDPQLEADAALDAEGYEAQRRRDVKTAAAQRRKEDRKREMQRKLHTPDDELPF